jgi:hypothetical protein
VTLSLTQRNSLFSKLSPLIGDEDADALLSQFPTRAGDEPVTRDVLRAELSEIRSEMAAVELRLTERLRQQTIWVVSVLFGGLSVGM